MRIKNENVTLERISIKLEQSVKQWYSDKAAIYGMPMAVYMQYILTQFCESQQNSEAVRNLSALGCDEDMKDTNKNLIELLKIVSELQEKQLKNSENQEP